LGPDVNVIGPNWAPGAAGTAEGIGVRRVGGKVPGGIRVGVGVAVGGSGVGDDVGVDDGVPVGGEVGLGVDDTVVGVGLGSAVITTGRWLIA
jgi:hypothetical protein